MSDQHPIIDDPELGRFQRAQTEAPNGEVLTHDWYVRTFTSDDVELELMIEATTADEARALLPRLRGLMSELASLRRSASDAVVTTFSQGEPEQSDLDEAAADLILETVEVEAGGGVVLHLVDSCENHFPEGYWPAVHLDADDAITAVTVES